MNLEALITLSLYCICELYRNVFLLGKKIRMYFLVKKMYSPKCPPVAIEDQVFRT